MKQSKISDEKSDAKFFPIFTAVHNSWEFQKRKVADDYQQAEDSEVWLMIFVIVYGEEPIHDESLPAHYARGVTDKRWNIMFHADEAYPSYKKFCVLNGI
jgi:hypothetical protein